MGWIEVRVVAVHNDPQGGYITISLPPPHGGERETEPSKLILKSAQRDPRQFPKGRLCLYYDKHSSRWVQATVTAVHSDPVEDFFSIQLPCGTNRDTVLANLYPLPAEPTHPPPSGGSSAQPPSAPAHGTRTALASSRDVVDLCDEPPAKRGRPSCAERQNGQSSAPLPKAQLGRVTGLAELLQTIEDAAGAATLDWCLKNDVDHVDQIVALGAEEEERFVRAAGVQPGGIKARLLRKRLEERRRRLPVAGV